MKYLLTGTLLLCVFSVRSQDAQTDRAGKVDLHLTAYRIGSTEFNRDLAVGVIGEFHFGEHLSSFFPLSFSDRYFQVGLGTLFAPLGLLSLRSGTDETIGGFLGQVFAVATAFESMGYRINVGEKKEIIPFYSLLRLTGVGNNVVKASENGYVSGSLGVMFRYHLSDRFHMNGYGELSHYYGVERSRGLQTGITIGYAFGTKPKE